MELSKWQSQETLGKHWYCKNCVSLLHLQCILLITTNCPQEHLIWINYCSILKISSGHFLPSPRSLTWAYIPVEVLGSFPWDICSHFHFYLLLFIQCFAPLHRLFLILALLLSAKWGEEMTRWYKREEKETGQKGIIGTRSNRKDWKPDQNLFPNASQQHWTQWAGWLCYN